MDYCPSNGASRSAIFLSSVPREIRLELHFMFDETSYSSTPELWWITEEQSEQVRGKVPGVEEQLENMPQSDFKANEETIHQNSAAGTEGISLINNSETRRFFPLPRLSATSKKSQALGLVALWRRSGRLDGSSQQAFYCTLAFFCLFTIRCRD